MAILHLPARRQRRGRCQALGGKAHAKAFADFNVMNVRAGGFKEADRFALGLDLLGPGRVDVSVLWSPEIGEDYRSDSGVARLSYRF